jgi:hypothetical protein
MSRRARTRPDKRRMWSDPDPEIKPRTGWPPGLLQDDDKRLSKWLASRPDSMLRAREAAAEITDWAQDVPEQDSE